MKAVLLGYFRDYGLAFILNCPLCKRLSAKDLWLHIVALKVLSRLNE